MKSREWESLAGDRDGWRRFVERAKRIKGYGSHPTRDQGGKEEEDVTRSESTV